jgi:hypothetical protein
VWCENWSVTLREEQRLRMFENMMLREILVFWPKEDKIRGEWERHNVFNDLYYSQNQEIKSRRTR